LGLLLPFDLCEIGAIGCVVGMLVGVSGFNFGPILFPAIATQDITEGQHGIHVGTGPMHARSFQANLDYQFIATLFDNATANWPATHPQRPPAGTARRPSGGLPPRSPGVRPTSLRRFCSVHPSGAPLTLGPVALLVGPGPALEACNEPILHGSHVYSNP